MMPWLFFLLALAPGVFAGWRGRRLASQRDEMLAERLFAHRRQVGAVAAFAAVLLVILAGVHATWTLPLLVLGLLRGSFGARRAALRESWGFAAYASHLLRFGAAAAGFFILLAAAPALALPFGTAGSVVLTLLLVVWASGSNTIFLALARARPLDRPDLAAHFERILGASRIAAPTLFRAGPRGGRMVNAFALPAWPRASILFTDDLLEQFAPDEIEAVFAHEVAHLEHFDGRRLQRRALALLTLIGLAAIGVPHWAGLLPAAGGWLPVLWALSVAVAVPLGLSAHRGHEAQSDRRALELGASPDALVRALVKLHLLAAQPRRMAQEIEQGATHPSLARRIQAVRLAAGTAPERLPATVVLAGVEAGRFVVLDDERVHWLAGAPEGFADQPEALCQAAASRESLAYAELGELHLSPGGGRVELVARTTAGRRLRVALRNEGAAAAQAALDLLDGRLAPARTGTAVPTLLGTLSAMALAFAALLGGHPLLLGPVALVALWRSGPVPLATAGVAAVAVVLGEWVGGGQGRLRPGAGSMLALAGVVAALAAIVLWLRVPDRRRSGLVATLLVQGAVGLLTLAGAAVAMLSGQTPPVASATAALLALSVPLMCGGRPWVRALAALPVAGATIVALVASLSSQSAPDPLALDPVPASRERMASLQPVASHSLLAEESDVRLSPSGRSFAARGWDEDVEWPKFRMVMAAGEQDAVEAFDLALIDDERALVLGPVRDPSAPASGAPVLELRSTGISGETGWRLPIEGLTAPVLSVDPAGDLWQIAGIDLAARTARLLSGNVRSGQASDARFGLPDGPRGLIVLGPQGGVMLRPRLRAAFGGMLSVLLATWTGQPAFETEVFLLTHQGPVRQGLTRLEIQCAASLSGPLSCLARDGERSSAWTIDPATGVRTGLGALEGAWISGPAQGGVLVAYRPPAEAVLVGAESGSLLRLDLGSDALPVVAPGGRVVGVTHHDETRGTRTLAVFSILAPGARD